MKGKGRIRITRRGRIAGSRLDKRLAENAPHAKTKFKLTPIFDGPRRGGAAGPKINFAYWRISYRSRPRAGVAVMDAASLRERAALCLRISRGLSWNNPARLQLMELAERLERQAKEFELQNHPAEKVA
jgi:hypothetical protein